MLQGSLENFALDEVLGLLSGTSKTGHLEIAGNRGTGSFVFHDGRLVDGTASFTANGTELEDVMFELLRYGDGTFTFSPREVTPTDLVENVATVLANAESRLQDWRCIETVVPSLSHQVVPVFELPSDEVTLCRDEWATLMTVGTGCPVSHVCERLSLGEVEGSRRIKNLAERQLVDVTDPIASRRNRSEATLSAPPSSAAPRPGATRPGATRSGATAASTRPGSRADRPGPAPRSTPANPSAAPSGSVATSNGIGGSPGTSGSGGSGSVTEASSLEALAGSDIPAVGPALASLMAERPPMPPASTSEELSDPIAGSAAGSGPPPGPPSPSEIAGFGESVEDASELMETVEEARGGILARYLKGEE